MQAGRTSGGVTAAPEHAEVHVESEGTEGGRWCASSTTRFMRELIPVRHLSRALGAGGRCARPPTNHSLSVMHSAVSHCNQYQSVISVLIIC